ncbi:MAG: hypothetical protein LUD47_01100 [Clostridia bacterium]|nr:hypothetical protein [Clostridia bacterium]
MSAFRTLFMMQLKEKTLRGSSRSAGRTALRIIFAVVGFAAVMAIAYLVFFLCSYLRLFSALGTIPPSVMSFIFFVMLVFTLITATVSLCRTLFQSADNQMLITFPVSPSTIYMSKICVSFVQEARRTFYFMIPIFFAYGVISAMPWYGYFWVFAMFMIFTAFVVMVSGFLALPVHYIAVFFKKFKAVGYVLGVILLAAVVVFVVWLIGLIPEDLNLIASWSDISQYLRKFLDWFYDHFYFCYAFVSFMCGKAVGITYSFISELTYIVLLVIIGSTAVFAAVNYVVSRYAYAKIAGREFEFNKKQTKKERKNRRRGALASNLRYDGKRTLMQGNLLTSLIAVVIIAPVSILLLNALFAAIDKRLLGDYLAVSFNVLIILLFATSSNVWVSAIYSRDGDALALYKTRPKKAFRALAGRLDASVISTILVVVPATVIFFTQVSFGAWDAAAIMVTLLSVTFGHLLWSAEMDYMNPKPQIYQTSGNAGINPNEIKSIALSFVLSIATMGIFIFFLMDGAKYAYLKILIFALVFIAYRVIAFKFKSRRLYEGGES